MIKKKKVTNDGAVDDAMAKDDDDRSRHVYLPDGSIKVYDENGRLVSVNLDSTPN